MFILKGKLESGSHAIGQTLLCPEIPPKRTFPFISTILGSQKLFQCLFSPRTFSSFCKPLVDLEMGMGEARDGASYVRLQDEIEDSDADDSKLKQLGYKPELSRSLSAISNFAVTFSIISVLTGITTLFGTGLEFGGPVTMIYGWPIAGAFTIVVGLSMAEICSAYPTSGGLYFWSAKLCGEQWGPFASWITGWRWSSYLTNNSGA